MSSRNIRTAKPEMQVCPGDTRFAQVIETVRQAYSTSIQTSPPDGSRNLKLLYSALMLSRLDNPLSEMTVDDVRKKLEIAQGASTIADASRPGKLRFIELLVQEETDLTSDQLASLLVFVRGVVNLMVEDDNENIKRLVDSIVEKDHEDLEGTGESAGNCQQS